RDAACDCRLVTRQRKVRRGRAAKMVPFGGRHHSAQNLGKSAREALLPIFSAWAEATKGGALIMSDLAAGSQVLFMLLGAILVFAMHAGFAFLEVGTVRRENQVNAL